MYKSYLTTLSTVGNGITCSAVAATVVGLVGSSIFSSSLRERVREREYSEAKTSKIHCLEPPFFSGHPYMWVVRYNTLYLYPKTEIAKKSLI